MNTRNTYHVTRLILTGLSLFGFLCSPVAVFAADVSGPCNSTADCNSGTCLGGTSCFCSDTSLGTGHCEARRAAGGPCTEEAHCQVGVTCNIVSLVCEAPHDQDAIDNCWCKKSDGTCENHTTNDGDAGHRLALQCRGSGSALTGSSAADTASCEAYCNFRGFRAVHCEPVATYNDYYTSDSTADESLRCLPRGSGAPTTPGYTPAGLGDGGEDRTSPSDFGFVNPLGSNDLSVIISRVIRAALGVVGAVFLAMFVYGGLMWMTAGDNAKRIETARSALINACIGMAIVAFSYSMVSIVFNLATQVSGGG